MKTLQQLVGGEIAIPVDPQVTAMAAAIAEKYPGSLAVLFYGSCLRESQLDGLMLDFYLIVEDYDKAYGKSWLARANRLIPPNVFPFSLDNLSAKYAILSETDFKSLMSPHATTVSVWARFAQPVRLVWVSELNVHQRMVEAIADAPKTVFHFSRPIAQSTNVLDIWNTGFAQTYKAELRAERTSRSGSIIDADPERYRLFGDAIPTEAAPMSAEQAQKRWRKLQRHGKLMTILRLAKASFTFAGGIDYLAWKINRHAGTKIEIQPWQRRWPLVAALGLVPKLLFRGAIR